MNGVYSSEHSQFDSNIQFSNSAIAKPKIRKTYIPSDDEDEEEEEEEDDQEDDGSSDSDAPDQRKQKAVLTPPNREEKEAISKNKATRKQPLPSDDESSASGKQILAGSLYFSKPVANNAF